MGCGVVTTLIVGVVSVCFWVLWISPCFVVCEGWVVVTLADVGWGVEGGTVTVETQALPTFLKSVSHSHPQ